MRRIWEQFVIYLKNSHELITIVMVYLAIAGVRLGRPDVEIKYELQNLAPAARLMSEIQQTSTQPPTALTGAATKIAQSPNLLRIEITNNTSNRVDDLEINVSGVSDAIDAAVVSSSKAMNRDAQKLATFATETDIVTFTNLTFLPPHAHVTVLLWGKIPLPPLGESVQANAAVPYIDVRQRETATGVRLFVARDLGLITFLLVAYFLLTTLARLRRENSKHDSDA